MIFFTICNGTRCDGESKVSFLRKFSIKFNKFKEAIKLNLMKMYKLKQKAAEMRRKQIEAFQRKREEARKSREEEKLKNLRHKIYQEHLLKKVNGKNTVLKDFFSRF
jgi:predicted phage tail protein